MSIKNKILIGIIPLMLISVILSNVAFWLFTKDYIQQQENVQVNVATESVSNFIDEKMDNYLGSVNDWAHWDDTYLFLKGQNPDYIKQNLGQSTFENLDLDFFLLIDPSGQIGCSQYYSHESNGFTPFPARFSADFPAVLTYAAVDSDVSFLGEVGGSYYFFAASDITDSSSTSPPTGRLIIGRILDADALHTIEAISGAKIRDISSLDPVAAFNQNNRSIIANKSYNETATSIGIDLLFPNPVPEHKAVQFHLDISRDIYLSSMRRLFTFTLLNTIGCTAIAALFIIIWGRILTKPFTRLVSEVGQIDTEIGKFTRVSNLRGKEISSLGKSINSLLGRIESAQKELSDNRKKLEATLTSVGDGVLAVDVEQNIVFMNPVAQKLTGWSFDEVKHTSIQHVFRIINEFTRETVPSPIQQVFERGEIVELANHTLLIAKDGSETPIEDTAAPIIHETGLVSGCVLVFRDSSERKERQKRIEYLSYHDQLTELYNRRFFEEELRRLDVERNIPLSIIYSDVNGLKVMNDAFGHEEGDRLLILVAETMRTTCRADDIVARIGGDEFVVLLPKTNENDAQCIVDRMKEGIGIIRINGISASVSFGIDTKSDSLQSTTDVMNNAERNMYQQKILDAGMY